MHACSLVSLVSTYNATVNAECATNEVVQFFVCCATFVLSVGLFFFNAELFFFIPRLFQRLVRKFSLKLTLRKLRFKSTSPGARAGICMGVRACGCVGDRFLFLFIQVCLSLFQQHAGTIPLTLVTLQHDRIPSQPYGHFLVGKFTKWEDLEWPAHNMRKVESIAGEVCVIGSSMDIRSAWAGLGPHLE